MDNNDIENRLARIEEKLNKIDYRILRKYENISLDDLKLELRFDNIEARISELTEVERIAQAAYLKTHPDANAKVEEAKETLDNAAFFESLPTVIDNRRDENRRESKS